MINLAPAKTLCKECGADRDVIREMLLDEKGSDNLEIALFMIHNCRSCQEALKENQH